jgi:CRISPR/Cas system CMR-associated protein Cmr5 small subunit
MGIDTRLVPFFDLSKYFIECSNINECLLEFNNTQMYISSIIKLRTELELEFKEFSREFEVFFSSKKDEIWHNAKKRGLSPTESNIHDTVIKLFPEEYAEKRERYDSAKANYEAANSLMMAMFQRKDMLCETIAFFKSKQENDNCLAKNKEFLKKLGVIIHGNS